MGTVGGDGTAGSGTLDERLRSHAAQRPDALALIAAAGAGATESVTWRELDQQVGLAGRALRAAGLRPGDRVALRLPTGAQFVQFFLGAWRAGLVSVPANPAYTAPELAHVLADSGARLVVSAVDEPRTDADVPVRTAADLLAGAAGAPGPGRYGEDTAVLIYTSGTSGRPRGAMLSARAISANLAQVRGLDLVHPDDIGLVPLPLFHVFGLNAALGSLLDVGATTVLVDRMDAGAVLDLMAELRVTTVAGAPAQFAAWAAHPQFRRGFATVRWAMSGSAALPVSLVERYRGIGVPLHEGYGLTETAPVLCTNVETGKPGFIGRPLPGVDVQLRDPDGGAVEQGDPGEIVVRGSNLFSGYWPEGAGGPDADGWFPTGDVAVADEDGDLTIVGRVTDMVNVSGFNVYPAEVESVLSRLPGVAEAAVTGEPDPDSGEAVVAFLVPEPGATLDPEDVCRQAARSLARFKLPRRIEIVDRLPHTVTGKVMKWRLIEERVGVERAVSGPA